MSDAERSKEMSRAAVAEYHALREQVPHDHAEAREWLTRIVAGWDFTPKAAAKVGRGTGGSKKTMLKKARASPREMAERRVVTKWLIETAERRLGPRGVAYGGLTLGLPKTNFAFRYIEREVLTLRESGLVGWEEVADDKRDVLGHGRWDDVTQMLGYYAMDYRRNLWADAPVQAQVWVEKAGIASALHDHARTLGLSIYPGHGFTGVGFLHEAIRSAAADHGGEDGGPRPLVLFEFLDCDDAGREMLKTVARRVAKFAPEVGVVIEAIVPVALTREQIAQYGIPTRPAKETSFSHEDGDEDAAELDAVAALYPKLLDDWLTEAVGEYWSADDRQPALEEEDADLAALSALRDNWPAIRAALLGGGADG